METKSYPVEVRVDVSADFTEDEFFFLKALKMPFESCVLNPDGGYTYKKHFDNLHKALDQMQQANKVLLRNQRITESTAAHNEAHINKFHTLYYTLTISATTHRHFE